MRRGGESHYASNRVCSHHYDWETCLPVCLLQQFHCTAHLWFLLVAVLQVIQIERDADGRWVTLAPLVLLLVIRLTKDLYWDYWRHKRDAHSNGRLYQVWDGQHYRDVACEDLVVGNYVLLKEGMKTPADMLVLSSGRADKACHVDNSISIGESSPQLKKPIKETSQVLSSQALERASLQINKLRGTLKLGEPKPSLDTLEATIKMARSPKAVPISVDSFLLRSSILKATPWVIGLVVYTGAETKLLLSGRKVERKKSRVERWIDCKMCYFMGVAVMMAFTFAIRSLFERENEGFWRAFLALFLQFSNLVPISLFVSLDLIRLLQTFLMSQDPDLNVDFNTPDITESLGQVEYLFLDSATLCIDTPAIDLIVVGESEYIRTRMSEVGQGKNLSREFLRSEELMASTTDVHNMPSEDGRSVLLDADIKGFEKLKRLGFAGDSKLDQFFACLALCTDNEGSALCKEDQVVLETLAELGCIVEQCTPEFIELNLFGRKAAYEVVAVWNSTPATKRSRVVVWKRSENCGYLFIKGAFSVMGNVLDVTSIQYKRLETSVIAMGTRGITPTVLGFAPLSESKLSSFRHKVETVRLAVTNIEEKLNKQFDLLEEEESVEYLGLVGFSQPPSPEVTECLRAFGEAGICTWLVSCGSETTSLAAAYSSGLTQAEQTILHLKAYSTEESLQQELVHCVTVYIQGRDRLASQLNYSISEFTHGTGMKRIGTRQQRTSSQLELLDDLSFLPHHLNYSVSIDYVSFQLALENQECTKLLTFLLFCATSVSFHSMPPAAKQRVVQFVRNSFSFHPVTAVLASAASDMGMMQSADVGFALYHKSRLAQNSSDLVVSAMGDLKLLILKHGQRNYLRVAKTILCFMYKNVLLTVVLMWYSVLSQYSGSPLLNPGFIACYHVLFTSLAVIAIGVLDTNVEWNTMQELPSLYQQDLFSQHLSTKLLVKSCVGAVLHSLMLIGLLFPALTPVYSQGGTETAASAGVLFGLVLVVTANVNVLVKSDSYSLPLLAAVGISVGLAFLYVGVATAMTESDLYDTLRSLFASAAEVGSLFLAPLAAFAFIYALSTYQKLFKPTFIDLYNRGKFSVDLHRYLQPFPRLSQFRFHLNKAYSGFFQPAQKQEKSPFQLSRTSLQFASKHTESQYQSLFLKEKLGLFRGVLGLLLVGSVVWTGVEAGIGSAVGYHVVRVLICVGFGVLLGVMYTGLRRSYYSGVMLCGLALGIVGKFVSELQYGQVGGAVAVLFALVSCLLLNVHFLLVSALNLLNILLFTITAALSLSEDTTEAALLRLLCYEALLITFSLIASIAGYTLSRTSKLAFKVRSNTEQEVERSRNIISLLLPPFVIDKVKDREVGQCIAEDQGMVTVIFCDIYDFDSICVLYKPNELTALLDDVFNQFDDLCFLNGVVKVETVGKTYMACAGLRYVDQDLKSELRDISHARRAVDFALDLLQAASNYKIKSGGCLQVKIGINSGPVISGVVGLHKPQFSLVGDTVNTASRMCSTLEQVNAVQVSEATKAMMVEQAGLVFESQTVFAKGKGNVQAYLVTGERIKSLTFSKFSEMLSNFTRVDSTRDIDFNEDLRKSTMKRPQTPITQGEIYQVGYLAAAEKQSLLVRKWNTVLTCAAALVICGLRVAMQFEAQELVCWEVVVARCATVLIALIYLHIWKRGRALFVPWVDFPFCLVAYTLSVFDLIFNTKYDVELVAMELMLLYLLFSWSLYCSLQQAFALAASLLVLWLALLATQGDWKEHLVLLALLVVHLAITLYSLHTRQQQLQLYAYFKLLEEQEVGKNEKLLGQMMPKRVYEKLKRDLPVTDLLRNISILFADIVGFTNWSSDKLPEEVVGMLSALFTQFDQLCVNWKLYKVHTIGDCYVVMGFDGSTDTVDPSMGCLRVFCMAHEMIRAIQEVNAREGIALNMRIGVHTGDVIAGITGSDVVRYDIYGSAVMVANKMESGGAAGQINVSEVTKEVLERVAPDVLEYTENREIEAKSIKKRYLSYFVKVLDEEKLMSLLEG